VRMEVEIEREPIIANKVIGQLLYCVYRWLFLQIRIHVISIQIFA
jgi:hypothetical protein